MQSDIHNLACPEVKPENGSVTTYHERKIRKTVYRITSIHRGEIDLAEALEALIVKRILYGNSKEECNL